MASNAKRRCKYLKGVRKRLADALGVDLHQRECTFEGECTGTCPRCRSEEERLNAVLMGRRLATAAAAALLATGLSGCAGEPAGGTEAAPLSLHNDPRTVEENTLEGDVAAEVEEKLDLQDGKPDYGEPTAGVLPYEPPEDDEKGDTFDEPLPGVPPLPEEDLDDALGGDPLPDGELEEYTSEGEIAEFPEDLLEGEPAEPDWSVNAPFEDPEPLMGDIAMPEDLGHDA